MLHLNASELSDARSMGTNGMPQCTFATRQPPKKQVSVIVNIDHGPSVEFRIERTVLEASQIFGVPPPGWKAPIGLNGLGPWASWFPTRGELMATNGTDLLTVSVNWNNARTPALIKLARAAVGPYMKYGHRPSPTAIVGYPG
ncbi:MAG TPA: hypothetical protein VME01_03710 [Solirubrobacteraceae bacterium]|nr:hypothetical protein [Solirubrobacteraceae bacterium]